MIYIFLWSTILFVLLTLSTFIHEIAHGLSSLIAGRKVSTGFAKVGKFGKTPSSRDFREYDFVNDTLIWDLGVPVTLILALISVNLLAYTNEIVVIMIVGASAYSNSLLRLIPCANSLYGLITKGKPNLEDEIGIGQSFKNIIELPFIEYVPLLISGLISLYTLNKTISLLHSKLKGVLELNYLFVVSSIVVIILNTVLLEWLDERFRINWGNESR